MIITPRRALGSRRTIVSLTTGQFVTNRQVLALQTITGGGTLTISGGAGGGLFTASQGVVNCLGVGSQCRLNGAGTWYTVTAFTGGTTITLAGAPDTVNATFEFKTLRSYTLFVPGTISGATAPYATLMALGGSGSKGTTNTAQMNEAGAVATSAGWPIGAQWSTTSPFGTDNWPFLTIFPQVALSNAGTDECLSLLDAIRADVEATYSCNPLKRYMTGMSDGANRALAYASGNPSLYAAVFVASGYCQQFFFSKFCPGYSGVTDADARAFAASALSGAGVAVRQYIGGGDTTPSIQTNFASDHTSFAAAYSTAGISSKYAGSVDEPAYGGSGATPWLHVQCYTAINQAAGFWSDLQAQHR